MRRCLSLLQLGLLLVSILGVMGCAFYRPQPVTDVPFQERAQTKTDGKVRVTVAVLSEEESRQIFGVPLYDVGIQPVWVHIENTETAPFWLLESGLDPAYFAPLEAAYVSHYSVLRLAGRANRQMDEHFQKLGMPNRSMPGSTISGFVFTNLELGQKVIDIDLVGTQRMITLTFIIPVPGLRTDTSQMDFAQLYTPEELIHYEDEQMLRAALEQAPCCTTNAEGTKNGDPLNLVLIGDGEDIAPAFIRSGWHQTEVFYMGSLWKTVKSAFFGSRYRYSPVSSLYVYGRQQDLALQKARSNVHQRNHLRLWLSPLRYQGKQVWLGQISRDIGTRLTTKTWWGTTHKIDPDVDEARWSLAEDFIYSQTLIKIGGVKGVGASTPENPQHNLTGDPYWTDGMRAVFIFDHQPVSLTGIDFLEWEIPEGLQPFSDDILQR